MTLGFALGILVGIAASKAADLLLAVWSEWKLHQLMAQERLERRDDEATRAT